MRPKQNQKSTAARIQEAGELIEKLLKDGFLLTSCYYEVAKTIKKNNGKFVCEKTAMNYWKTFKKQKNEKK